MGKLRVNCFSISLDGFGAGPKQDSTDPLGVGGEALHDWMITTQRWQQTHGGEGGTTGEDDKFASRFGANVGAFIMGRNMFAPMRGSWQDDSWRGWWGENPPYHTPVFVLTHHPRSPVTMEGGTTFHFVTEGIHHALELARQAAGDKDVQIGGGVSTIRQYLSEGLIDELHIAISPILLGQGESLFRDLNLLEHGYTCTQHIGTTKAMHLILTKSQ